MPGTVEGLAGLVSSAWLAWTARSAEDGKSLIRAASCFATSPLSPAAWYKREPLFWRGVPFVVDVTVSDRRTLSAGVCVGSDKAAIAEEM